jgi:serine protease Do
MESRLLNFANSSGSHSTSSSPHSRGFADMSLFVARRLGLVAAVAIAVGACSPQSSAAPQGQTAAAGAQVENPTATPPVGTLNGRALPDFATLVETVGPAVVNVSVVEKAHRVRNRSSNDDSDDQFEEFFRRFGIPVPDQGQGGGRRGFEVPQRQGEGSGFIVSDDGYILTNAHVVADADEVTVRMTDRREYPAKVIGVDRRTDVAVIKIEGKNLPVVRIGYPSKLRPGEWVLAEACRTAASWPEPLVTVSTEPSSGTRESASASAPAAS